MGLSASQARFLQLTARRSNLEYQAQQISQERLRLSSNLEEAATEYQEKISNYTMQFSFNNGEGTRSVNLSYKNYLLYMNQQEEGLITSQDKYYLVSSTGKKIVVSSEDEIDTMIKNDTTKTLTTDDFIVTDGLDDTSLFQSNIESGAFYFATYTKDETTGTYSFNTKSWETLGSGAISQVLDTSDDAAAEAKYEATQIRLQKLDKSLEVELDQIEKERTAVDTEIDSVKKTIENNVEQSFNIFS